MVRITRDPASIDLALAHRWLASAYWSTTVPLERFARACANRLVCAAFEDDRPVGFARVATDRASFMRIAPSPSDVYGD